MTDQPDLFDEAKAQETLGESHKKKRRTGLNLRESYRTKDYGWRDYLLNFIRNLVWPHYLVKGEWYEVELQGGRKTCYFWDGRKFHTASRPLRDHLNIEIVLQRMTYNGVVPDHVKKV